MKRKPSQLDLFSSPAESSGEGGRLIIFQSSAGSGKTFALVKEYIKIILKDPSNFSHVLAVTFTNAATREMKYRILDVLEELASGTKSEMREAIENDFKRELKDHLPIEKRANEALNNILYNYAHFDVSTIDHFFTRVVRALAYELKQPVKYDIDVDNELAVENAIEKLYSSIHENREVRNWLKEFALSRLEDDKGWYIEHSLSELGMELFQEKFREFFDDEENEINIENLHTLVEGLTFVKESYTRDLRSLSKQALEIIAQFDLNPSDLKGGARGVGNGFIKILDGNYQFNKTFNETIHGYQDWYSQTSRKREIIKKLANEGLDDIGRQMADHYDKFHRPYITATELLKNIYSYGLMGEMHNNLQEYKLDNNILLLSDISSLLRKVISENDAPFIYEKLGSRYKHLLIDEFQDTSNFQWANLKPLVINSISNGNHVYLAGDVKQSIYRWRGGNLHLILSDAKNDLNQYGTVNERPLDINYRSAQNIVDFNNAFFETASQILQQHPEADPQDHLVSLAYTHVRQKSYRNEEGYVQVSFLEKPEDRDTHWHSIARERTVQVIKDCLEDGFQHKDILILVDAGWLGNEMADHLTGESIPVITENSLLIENNQKVKMLLNVLKWFDNPADRVAKAAILHHYFEINGNPSKYLDHQLYSVTEQDIFFEMEIPEKLIKEASFLKQLPIYELVEELIILFKLNKPPDVFVQKFLDLCLNLSNRGINSISSFFKWWDKKLTRKDKSSDLGVKVPSETNAVEITTIHQAKGLQRPVVIVPFAGDKFEMKTKSDSIFWTSELPDQFDQYKLFPLRFSNKLIDSEFTKAYQQELMEGIVDRLNVAYVAFTRAEDRLYIFTNGNKKEEDAYGNLHRLMYAIFTNPTFVLNSKFDLLTRELILGKKEKKKEKGELKADIELVEHLPSRPYADKVTIRRDSSRFFLLFDNATANKIREGIIVHAAMEATSSVSEIDKALEKLEAQGLLNKGQKESVRQKVEMLLTRTDITKWIEEGWKPVKENEIFYKGEIYKPDMVLLKEDKAIVIDYKREKRSHAHQDQIRNYGKIMEEMGVGVEKRLLIYLDEFEIEEVST